MEAAAGSEPLAPRATAAGVEDFAEGAAPRRRMRLVSLRDPDPHASAPAMRRPASPVHGIHTLPSIRALGTASAAGG